MPEIKFDIVQEVSVITEYANGWRKEINLISWNGREAKYDIRDWSEGRKKMGKGITLSTDELKKLRDALKKLNL